MSKVFKVSGHNDVSEPEVELVIIASDKKVAEAIAKEEETVKMMVEDGVISSFEVEEAKVDSEIILISYPMQGV